MPGAGKRIALQRRLAEIAALRGMPFTITMRPLQGNMATSPSAEESATASASEDAGADAVGQIMMESSLVHTGFDIARMSMQDKQVLRPILQGLGQGSQVLAGQQGRGSRILVFYHAHLLSSESVLLIQSCLEMNEGDVSIWFTSELPAPQRIRDWFVEIPVATTEDRSLTAISRLPLASWTDVFHALFARWAKAPAPTIETIKEVKAVVYEFLMRNLRWTEVIHYLLDVILTNTAITELQRRECIRILATYEATASGYTIPSYRIPVLWESLFLQFRNVVQKTCDLNSGSPHAATRSREAHGRGKKSPQTATS